MVNGTVHHFAARGLYNGLVLLGDYESGSYWDHITGECVYGPLEGQQLEVFPLSHSTAGQALAVHPEIQIAISDQTLLQRLLSWMMERQRQKLNRGLPPNFARTMGPEDQRRPRMDRGLGVWTEQTARYYPLETIEAASGVFIDVLDNRRVLIYCDPLTGVPAAVWTSAEWARWNSETLELDTGERVENGVFLNHEGAPHRFERPLQIFTRWYGFALTFQNCDVYGDM